MNPGELTWKQAQREIVKILARVPDAQIPKPDRIENRGEDECAWYGGKGWYIAPKTTCESRAHVFALIDLAADEWLRRERVRRYGKGFEFRDGKQLGVAS